MNFSTFQFVIKWSARLIPAFCAPLCLSAFFTPTSLRNIAFWVAFISILCCFCVRTAYNRNNRYLLIPFVILKLFFFIFVSLVSFYVMIRYTHPPLIDHLKDSDELFDSYLRFTFVAILNGFLTTQCVLCIWHLLLFMTSIMFVISIRSGTFKSKLKNKKWWRVKISLQ